MITFVKCANEKCAEFGREKSVVSAAILGMDAGTCPACQGRMQVARQINVSQKGGGKKISTSRGSGTGMKRSRKKLGRKRSSR
jgi:predicted nucleic acid-binding Zn ribbon protein